MTRTRTKFSLALGIAMLLQAAGSLTSGILCRPLLDVNDVTHTLLNIAGHQTRAQLSVLIAGTSALAVIWLGALLYLFLREHGQVAALTAMSFYVLEAILLVTSRLIGHSLITLASQYASSRDPALLPIAGIFADARSAFGNTAMVCFAAGAILFYALLIRSKAIPTGLATWGLIAVLPVPIVSIMTVLNPNVPFAVGVLVAPYVPFEFVVAIYVLARGLPGVGESQ